MKQATAELFNQAVEKFDAHSAHLDVDTLLDIAVIAKVVGEQGSIIVGLSAEEARDFGKRLIAAADEIDALRSGSGITGAA